MSTDQTNVNPDDIAIDTTNKPMLTRQNASRNLLDETPKLERQNATTNLLNDDEGDSADETRKAESTHAEGAPAEGAFSFLKNKEGKLFGIFGGRKSKKNRKNNKKRGGNKSNKKRRSGKKRSNKKR